MIFFFQNDFFFIESFKNPSNVLSNLFTGLLILFVILMKF